MEKYANIIEHDRIIASVNMIPTGVRPQIDPYLENATHTPADAPIIPIETPITGWTIDTIANIAKLADFDLSNEAQQPISIFMNASSTKLFVLNTSSSKLLEYSIIAGDISTASYIKSANLAADAKSVFIDYTGTKLFVSRDTSDNGSIYIYTMKAWDIDTLTLDDRISIPGGGLHGIFLNENGFHMYVTNTNGQLIHMIMTHPWNTKTAYEISRFDFSETIGEDIGRAIINPAGDRLYVIGSSNHTIKQYELSSPYYTASATFIDGETKIILEDNITDSMYIVDSDNIYVLGYETKYIHQYVLFADWELDNWAGWDLLSSTTLIPPDAATVYDIFINDEITKLYTITWKGNIAQWSFTGTDLSTLALDGHFTIDPDYFSQGADYITLNLSHDGKYFFVVSTDYPGYPKYVQRWTLNTAWDISTRTDHYVVLTDSTFVNGMNWTADGLKAFSCGADIIYEYTMTTPFDIATRSPGSDLNPNGDSTKVPFVNNAGSRFIYHVGSGGVQLYSINGTPFDLSDTTYLGPFPYPLGSSLGSIRGLWLSTNGNHMAISDHTNRIELFKRS